MAEVGELLLAAYAEAKTTLISKITEIKGVSDEGRRPA
jgi:hypothetical protein